MESNEPIKPDEDNYRCVIHDIITEGNPCPVCQMENTQNDDVGDFIIPKVHPPACGCFACFKKSINRAASNIDINKQLDPKEKHGAKKPPLALLPKAFNEETAKALQFGGVKHGPWNWRLTEIEMMTYLHAAKRHIDELIERNDYDEESGVHHLGHVAANCAIILDAIKHGTLVDNRPPNPSKKA